MANVRVLKLSDSKEWHEYLCKLPIEHQDIYFTPEYYNLYERNGEGSSHCFVFESNGEIALYPFLKNEINCLGYNLDRKYFDIQGAYGYNGVIYTTNNYQFASEFYNEFNAYCSTKNVVAEFTRFHTLIGNKVFSERFVNVVYDRKTVYIDLRTSYDSIFGKFQTSTRKQIKRATNRYNIEVITTENDVNQLNTFLQIYHSTMDRVGSDPYLYFNKEYIKSILESTQNVCFTAYVKDKPIAAIIAFYNQVYVHGHLGGALLEYLPMYPYSLLYSEMIKFGQSKGCHYLHVGGGASSDVDDSLFKFKLNFSKTTMDFFIGKRIHNKEVYDSIVNIWEQKFPDKRESYKSRILKYRY